MLPQTGLLHLFLQVCTVAVILKLIFWVTISFLKLQLDLLVQFVFYEYLSLGSLMLNLKGFSLLEI